MLYAESSGVLAWLLGERDGPVVRRHLAAAPVVVASRITLAECERALVRAVTVAALPQRVADDRRATLHQAAGHWHVFEVNDLVLDRVGAPYPVEPVGTLAAIHLATMLELRRVEPRLTILSLDQRIRANAAQLRCRVLP